MDYDCVIVFNARRTVIQTVVLRTIVAVILVFCSTVSAHEAWLEPFNYHLDKSPRLSGNIRVGEFFRGNTQLYNPDQFKRFEVFHKGESRKIKGRLGDLPAIKFKLKQPGLHTLIYQSTGNVIHYPTWEKFVDFTDKEGLTWVQQSHSDRGLPTKDFSEVFMRYAKTLIDWKTSEGEDVATGMPFEILALTNPYQDNPTVMEIQVLWQGSPYDKGQLTTFRKSGDAPAERTTVVLDNQGKARIPLEPGVSYLLNSVFMEPISGKKKAPVWRSHWASMTFQTKK